MACVDLYDTLVLRPEAVAGRITLGVTGEALPSDSRNLVVRAAEMLQERSGKRPGVRIELTKRIPIQAGLGGGSSDAAATLVALNMMWQLGLGIDALGELGRQLGSDIPFFLVARSAVCRGRGEHVEALPRHAPLDLVLVIPPCRLSTAEVFRRGPIDLTEPRRPLAPVLKALASGRASALGPFLFNRLTAAAYRLQPDLTAWAAGLAGLNGCAYGMTGSGTAHYVLCSDRPHAQTIASAVRASGWGQVHVTQTIG